MRYLFRKNRYMKIYAPNIRLTDDVFVYIHTLRDAKIYVERKPLKYSIETYRDFYGGAHSALVRYRMDMIALDEMRYVRP